MTGDKIRDLVSLHLANYCFFTSLVVRRSFSEDEGAADELTLTLAQSPNAGAQQLRLTFTDVREVELGDLSGVLAWQLEIYDVADRGMEGLRYRVIESEHELLRMWCREFEARELPTSPTR